MRYFTTVLFAVVGLAVFAQDTPQAFTGAHIIPIEGAEIENGLLVISKGKITYVGKHSARKIPKNAQVHDLKGKVIMPGLVDTHSHIGGPGGADRSNPIQPDCRVLDSINARSSGFVKALAGGITVANIMPGSGHLMSGQTLYVKYRRARTISDLYILNEDGKPMGGMKMANGTNSRGKPPFPGTRAKSVALVRARFIEAQHYRDQLAKAADDPEKKAPARDLGKEALIELMERKKVVHHHTHRHDDILSVLRLSKEFGFEVVLHHLSEGWKVADEIAASGASASIIVIDSPGGKLEARDLNPAIGAIFEKAGVVTAFHTDVPITDARLFMRSAGLAVRYGMSRGKALEGLTIVGAKMLHLDDRVGSLKKGKDADFLIMDGDPLSVYTHTQETWIEGVKVFDLSNEADKLMATGGYGAGEDQSEVHIHDLDEWGGR